MKIVINILQSGFDFNFLTKLLREHKISPEMCDDTYLVLMVTPENPNKDLDNLLCFFNKIAALATKKEHIQENMVKPVMHTAKLSIKEAIFTKQTTLPVSDSIGRVCAAPVVSCPPAVPVIISGEVITEEDVLIMKKYHIEYIDVVS